MKHNDIIYQIFPRNYAYDKPFITIADDLNRIKDLGVDIIYLMPIHEIGIKNRKGTYGSPYAIRDYYSISPDLGTLEEFKYLINQTHCLGMKIILDMVFNHTSPDNVLIKEHEDYYYHKDNKLANRVGDWSDIVDLETSKLETQNYLINVLKYWVNLGVDGFRFDVASMIDFNLFKRARNILGKDIIFIGESIDPDFYSYLESVGIYPTKDDDMYPVFDSLYNYNYFRILINYINRQSSLEELITAINKDGINQRLLCLENHDNERIASLLNKDQLAKYLDFFSFIKGQIFIYAGEEYGNKHKPELFEKDVVDFNDIDINIYKLYKDYINKKKLQKEIINQHIEIIDFNTVKVSLIYIDNTTEEKEFVLPN